MHQYFIARRFFVSALFLIRLFITPSLYAQTQTTERDDGANGAAPPPEELVDLYFAVYVWPATGLLTENTTLAGVPRIFYHSPDGIRRVPAGRNVTSPLMLYRGPMPLELFDGKWVETPPPADAPPDTEPTRAFEKVPVANLEIPAEWKQALLVMFPGQTGPDGGIRILPIRYDVDRVRPDFIRIHNTSDVSLIAEAEGEVFTLPEKGIVNFQSKNRGGHHAFRISFYSLDDQGQPKLRYTTRIVDIEGRSNLYLLYQSDPRRFRLQRVGGHEPPPTPTPEPPRNPESRNRS